MPHFSFKSRKPNGEVHGGERDAADRFELYRMIRESGEEIVSVDEKKGLSAMNLSVSFKAFSRVKTMDKINFARNLGLMLQAGLALSRSLSVIERQTKSKALKEVVADLSAEINKGSTFADALEKHSKVFPPIFVSMVHAGEQSGALAEALKAIASQMDASYGLSRRVRGAMIYPAVILGVMVAIAILMMIFVVPTLMKTFSDLGVPLPAATRFILFLSTAIETEGLWVFLGFAAAVGLLYWWSKKPSGRKMFHMLLIKAPILGPITKEVNSARTARTLSSLLSAGVEVVESVDITSKVVQNVYFRAVLDRAREAIKKGELMSKTFAAEEDLYPPFFAEMMSVGEETGAIGDMLGSVAAFYENDVDQKTKDMSTVVEPVLIVVIGAAVGFFAVSMISPMYSLVNAIH